MPIAALNATTPAFNIINQFKYRITAPLVKHVFTHNWQELLMLGGTLFAVMSAVAAFFYGSTVISCAFLVCAALNAASAFYMHQFSALKGLKSTVNALKVESERISTAAKKLEHENATLSQTNTELTRTSDSLKQSAIQLNSTNSQLLNTNQQLKNTNTALQRTTQELEATNGNLTRQVEQLSIQVPLLTSQVTQLQAQVPLLKSQIAQLTISAELIQKEVDRLQTANGVMEQNGAKITASVRALEEQIASSQSLYATINAQLGTHERSLGEQIDQIKNYFQELTALDSVQQRVKDLGTLHAQIKEVSEQLHAVKNEYAQERARIGEISHSLAQLREEYTTLLSDMRSSNTQHQTQNQQLQQQVDRILGLLHV